MLYRRTISARPAAGCGLSGSRGPPGRGRLVTRYQVALSGRVAGSAVATTRRRTPSGPHPPSLASAARQVSACPSRNVRTTGCQSPGSSGHLQASADRQLGAEPRVGLPLGEVPRRGVRHRVHRIVHALVGPQRGDGDHPVVGLAVPAQPLPAHVRRLGPVLAVPAVIDHQHPRLVRRGRRVRPQQLQPPGVDLPRIPPRLRQEELQPLHRRMLRPGHRLSAGQRGQRLVPVPRRQQPGQVLPEPPPLRHTAKKIIEPGRIPLQRTRSRRTRHRLRHRSSPAPKLTGKLRRPYPPAALTQQTTVSAVTINVTGSTPSTFPSTTLRTHVLTHSAQPRITGKFLYKPMPQAPDAKPRASSGCSTRSLTVPNHQDRNALWKNLGAAERPT